MEKVTIMEIVPEDLRRIQFLQLEILKEVDRICRKYNIKYTLCGGSLLGAIRHKGIIPWDDDIDISMLREEYDKFCYICEKELDKEKFFLQTMDTDPEYRLIYGKILLNDTAYVRAGYEHLKCRNGIFIDIFPRDGCSNVFIIEKIQRSLAFLMRKILYSPVGAVRNPKRINRTVMKLLRKFPRSTASTLLSIIQWLNFGKKTKHVVCFGLMDQVEKKKCDMGKEGYREYKKMLRKESKAEKLERKELNKGLQRVFFEDVIDAKFEDMQAMVTNYYDAWLKMNYDDYMSLPPVEKRVIHQTVSYYSLGKYAKE